MIRRAALCLLALCAPLWAEGFDVLQGHGGPIHDVAISADGRFALTASFDNSVGLWDLSDGGVHWLDGHEAAVKTVTMAGPGQAASGGDDFTIRLWNLDQTTPKTVLTGHKGQIAHLAASPDGHWLASASWDGTIGLWSATENHFLRGHSGAVNAVAFAPGSDLIYSASADGTIRVWDVAQKTQKRILIRHGFGVNALLLHPDGDWLAYGAVDGGTRVIDLSTGEIIADLTLDRRPILDMAATRDFSQIAAGDGEGHIMVVNTDTWRIAHDFRAAKRGPIWALAYDATGQRLLTGGIEDSAYFWPIGAKDAPLMSQTQRDFLKSPDTMSNGERQFARKCSICHSLSHDGIRRAGPSLAGLFGRRAGTYPGYLYSDTVANSDITWTAETIDALFDLGPEHYIPGTKMPMQRITSPQDRADLIDYLRANTKG